MNDVKLKKEPILKIATIMVYSGELDKILFAFVLATGMASMGWKVNMWFTMWGINALKKRKGIFKTLFRNVKKGSRYSRGESNSHLQTLMELMNQGDANHLPMSKLNLAGMGPLVMKYLSRRKNIPSIPEFIDIAVEQGINFNVCQLCVDVMAVDENDLIVENINIEGISQFALECENSSFQTFI